MAMKLKESIRTARAGLIESTINTEEGAAPYLCFYTGAPPSENSRLAMSSVGRMM